MGFGTYGGPGRVLYNRGAYYIKGVGRLGCVGKKGTVGRLGRFGRCFPLYGSRLSSTHSGLWSDALVAASDQLRTTVHPSGRSRPAM